MTKGKMTNNEKENLKYKRVEKKDGYRSPQVIHLEKLIDAINDAYKDLNKSIKTYKRF